MLAAYGLVGSSGASAAIGASDAAWTAAVDVSTTRVAGPHAASTFRVPSRFVRQ
nr:hypothetical protein [Actinomycetospora chiangmaiensis]